MKNALPKYDPAVDLMSRRHPLSSTRAYSDNLANFVLGLVMTCRHQAAGNSCRSEVTSSSSRPCWSSSQSSSLRSSPSSLLSFLGHVALLMLVRWLNRCVHSGIEMHYIPNTPRSIQKNSVPLKEVLTPQCEIVRSVDVGDITTCSRLDAKSAATTTAGVGRFRKNAFAAVLSEFHDHDQSMNDQCRGDSMTP